MNNQKVFGFVNGKPTVKTVGALIARLQCFDPESELSSKYFFNPSLGDEALYLVIPTKEGETK